MQKFTSKTLLPFDLKIEHTHQKIRKERREAVNQFQETMVDADEARNGNNLPPNNQLMNNPLVVNQPMALRDYALPLTGIQSIIIRRPVIQANNFELKPVTS